MRLCVEDEGQPTELCGIAGRGAGAMSLDHLDGLGAVACDFIGPGDRLGLPLGNGGVHALGAAIRAGSHAGDDCVDLVPIPLRIVQPLEGHHADSLAQHRAVCLVRKGAAVSTGAQRWGLAEAHEHEDVVQGVHPAGDHQVRVPEVQFVDRHAQGGEGGGAGGIGNAVGTAQVQAVGDAAGHDVSKEAREAALLPGNVMVGDALADGLHISFREPVLPKRLLPDGALQAADHGAEKLLGARYPQNDGHARSVHFLELVSSGILQDLLGDDEGQELTGVSGLDDAWRHAPAHGIKVDVSQEAAAAGIGLVGRGRIRIVVVLREPVGVGHVGDEVRAGQDVSPETGGRRGAWKERRGSDHGDGGTAVVVSHVSSPVGVKSRRV